MWPKEKKSSKLTPFCFKNRRPKHGWKLEDFDDVLTRVMCTWYQLWAELCAGPWWVTGCETGDLRGCLDRCLPAGSAQLRSPLWDSAASSTNPLLPLWKLCTHRASWFLMTNLCFQKKSYWAQDIKVIKISFIWFNFLHLLSTKTHYRTDLRGKHPHKDKLPSMYMLFRFSGLVSCENKHKY